MSSPVEMEFAVKLDVPAGEPKVFSFLQLRPIVEEFDLYHTVPDDIDQEETIILSNSALGNGKYDSIHDIVYIKPESFNPAKTQRYCYRSRKNQSSI
jgi:hypothetical protein